MTSTKKRSFIKLSKEQRKELYKKTRFGIAPSQPAGLTMRQRLKRKDRWI